VPWLPLVIAVYGLSSLVTAALYWRDKRAAGRRARRVPERVLHCAELLGGWPGALVAGRVLRHKKRKVSYRLTIVVIITIHVLIWLTVAWLRIQRMEG